MKSRISILILFIALTACSNSKNDELEIRKVMASQQNAWNNQDIKGFMNGYWNSDSLAFVGSKGITYGWEPVYQNYLKNYNSPAKMGKLNFNILKLEVDGRSAFMLGEWNISSNTEENNKGGYFTLRWKKIKGEWKIVLDHTS